MKEYLDGILRYAVNIGASDIHLKANKPPILRVSAQLITVEADAPTDTDMVEIARAIIPEFVREKFKTEHEVDFSYFVPDIGRFRTNVYTQRGQINMAMRYVKSKVPDFNTLNLPEVLKKISMSERGIVFVAGATGSGKSTTLACMLEYVNMHDKCHVVTLEDPIEFVFEDKQCVINQREVGLDTLSFKQALKNVLRQDPDIIMVGEMRDAESFSAAITAAETGHLVMTTVHSNNASQTITRVLDFFPMDERVQILRALSGCLQAVICQRMIPAKTGGAAPAIEILINTPLVRKLLEEGKLEKISSAIEAGGDDGMQSFNQSIYKLIKNGLITEEDGIAKASNPDQLKMNLKGIFLDESRRIIG
ncbi:MAG: PilT/PilU family type 4a pilus ATPase [Verrucomicrobia bacterium]|nr:PilT/PilU family type 4a pilus ATPase [Verrucomicrobiota bacterium]